MFVGGREDEDSLSDCLTKGSRSAMTTRKEKGSVFVGGREDEDSLSECLTKGSRSVMTTRNEKGSVGGRWGGVSASLTGQQSYTASAHLISALKAASQAATQMHRNASRAAPHKQMQPQRRTVQVLCRRRRHVLQQRIEQWRHGCLWRRLSGGRQAAAGPALLGRQQGQAGGGGRG